MMEDGIIFLLGFLLTIVIIGGSICGIVAVFGLNTTNSRIVLLEQRLTSRVNSMRDSDTAPMQPASDQPEADMDPIADPELESRTPEIPDTGGDTRDDWTETVRAVNKRQPGFFSLVRNNWMIWLGGFSVALGGIFLVIYSIEQGLLGPLARVLLGIFFGIAMHVGAEYLRRRTASTHPALGALAGAGSITMFAALLSALHLYDLINPTVAFILLAMVALATMWMALVHGPMLATFGILGAYLVPAMVASDEGRIVVALVYSLIISASALLLLRHIYRSWLWWGFIFGALSWWAISITETGADDVRGVYLCVLGYMILAIPTFNWTLVRAVPLPWESWKVLNWFGSDNPERNTLISFLLLILAQGISIYTQPDYSNALLLWSPLVILTLIAARYQESLNFMPWLLLIVQGVAWFLPQIDWLNSKFTLNLLTAPEDTRAMWYLGITSLIFSGFALANLASCRFKAIWASLGALAPVLLLLLCYLLTSRLLPDLQWGLLTAMLAMVYLGLATVLVNKQKSRKQTPETLVVWLFFGGHFALSLAAVMILDEATLTLAFAAQLISTAWIIKQFNLPTLDWMLKILVAIVVTRLTFNPWVAGYGSEMHWSLWTYGGATGCCVAAAWLLRQWPAVSRWAEGAALHLFVLTLWSETRYWLYDGSVFEDEFKALEAGIYILLFGILSLVYYYRSLVSQNLQFIYRLFSILLMFMALFNYTAILIPTLFSSDWVAGEIGTTPLWNMMLLFYGAPVLLGVLYLFLHAPIVRTAAAGFTGIAAFVFISLEIRHLWQSSIILDVPTSSAELYTYSAVWLIMAIAAILSGAWKLGNLCYRSGMILLALVIAKIFIVDMSDLEGLLRVASFMGLGLALLGISFLHQRIQNLR